MPIKQANVPLSAETREQFEQHLGERLIQGLTSEEFIEFAKQNIQSWQLLMSYYRCAMMEVETKFKVLNEQFSVQYDRNPIETIKTRMKSLESIAGKMRKKNLPLTLEALESHVFDIAGIRVICSFPEDIYLLAECLLKQDDITLIQKKDYIMNPKLSGYRSLHLIVEVPIFLEKEKRLMKVEVQLRTIAMDFWASLEHKLRYKKNISPQMADDLTREMLECAQISADLDRRMEAVRNRLEKCQSEQETAQEETGIHLGSLLLPRM